MDARALDHIRDVESKFETDEEIYQLRRKITLPQANLPELVDIGKGFFSATLILVTAIGALHVGDIPTQIISAETSSIQIRLAVTCEHVLCRICTIFDVAPL